MFGDVADNRDENDPDEKLGPAELRDGWLERSDQYFADPCDSERCDEKASCSGFFTTGRPRFSRGIRAITTQRDELTTLAD